MAVTWDQIKAMFTTMDVDHMKRVSANWPKVMDLHDEESVLYYATQIPRMPIGEPTLDPADGVGFSRLVEKPKPIGKTDCVTDTESNVDAARIAAQRIINDGAQCIVGNVDFGGTLAVAQVCEQRGVPLVVNVGAAPQITEQGVQIRCAQFPARGNVDGRWPSAH